MKKVLFLLLVAGTTLTFSCNPKKNTVQEAKDVEGNITQDIEAKNNTGNQVEEKTAEEKATAELCACINNSLANMSPRVRSIIIKAGKSSEPIQVLQTELLNISDAEEQLRLGAELQEFENNQQLQNCFDKIKKKYNLDDNDQKAQNRILEAAEKNKDCDMVYALMKIGMQQDSRVNGTGGNQ